MERTRDWIDVLQALLAPTIALIAVAIGAAQWRTARNKLKLEMFDRRWEVYAAIRDVLAIMSLRGGTTLEDEIRFTQGARGASALLDNKIDGYVTKTIPSHLAMLKLANGAIASATGQEERDAGERDRLAQMVWARGQYSVVDAMFTPHLSIRETEFLWWPW